jgi:hypothetical protein
MTRVPIESIPGVAPLRGNVICDLSLMDEATLSMLTDRAGSLPRTAWGDLGIIGPCSPGHFCAIVDGARVEYYALGVASGVCPACSEGFLLIAVVIRKQLLGLLSSKRDIVHCVACGIYSLLPWGTGAALIGLGLGLHLKARYLGEGTDLATLFANSDSLPSVLAAARDAL